MERLVAGYRFVVALAIIAAVVATLIDVAGRGPINPFNFFGYFTVQSNLLFAATLLLTSVPLLRVARPGWVAPLRACLTTYMVIVGLVYAVLLAPLGAAGGVPVPWANALLHIVTPLVAVVDWLIAPDRRRLPWRTVGIVLLYPLVWLAVVLIRGATDGWVPYPFLDPATGYAAVFGYVALITAVFIAVGSAVLASSRLRPLLRSTTPVLEGAAQRHPTGD